MIDDFEAASALLFTYEERTSTGLRSKTAPDGMPNVRPFCAHLLITYLKLKSEKNICDTLSILKLKLKVEPVLYIIFYALKVGSKVGKMLFLPIKTQRLTLEVS